MLPKKAGPMLAPKAKGKLKKKALVGPSATPPQAKPINGPAVSAPPLKAGASKKLKGMG